MVTTQVLGHDVEVLDGVAACLGTPTADLLATTDKDEPGAAGHVDT